MEQLWEQAQQHSDAGRFHEAAIAYEQAKVAVEREVAALAPLKQDPRTKRTFDILQELMGSVKQELQAHHRLLEGNLFVALGVKSNCTAKVPYVLLLLLLTMVLMMFNSKAPST